MSPYIFPFVSQLKTGIYQTQNKFVADLNIESDGNLKGGYNKHCLHF